MHEGNLVYRKTARNFNPMMATAGRITVAEVEELVAVGALDADSIHTPGIFVKRIVHGHDYREAHRETHRARGGERLMAWTRDDMAKRARRANCATGSTSISASAFRPLSPTTFPTAWT